MHISCLSSSAGWQSHMLYSVLLWTLGIGPIALERGQEEQRGEKRRACWEGDGGKESVYLRVKEMEKEKNNLRHGKNKK